MNVLYFDINACIICTLLLITITAHKGVRLQQNRLFIYLLLSVLCAAVTSMLSGLGQNQVMSGSRIDLGSDSVLYLTTFLYMAFHMMCPLLFYLYVRVVLNIDGSRLSDAILSFAPIITAYTVLALTPVNDAIFYFRGGRYFRGDYMWLFYIVALWYTFVAINYVVLYRDNLRTSVTVSFMSFALFAVVGVIIQYFDRTFKIESFFNAVVLLILYITIERPGDYMDSETGLQNDYAFYVNVAIRIKRRRGARMVVVSLDNVDFLDSSIGYETTSRLLILAAESMEKISKDAVTYRLERDLFVIMIKEGTSLTHIQIMDAVRHRFAAPFSTGNYSIMLFDCSMSVCWPDDVKDTEELKRLITLFSEKDRHKMKHVMRTESIDLEMDRRRRSIDTLLHNAIVDESFNFRYQPVKSTATGRFDSVEMKPMIESPEFGMIAPGEYYPIAEENGTAVAIIKHIFRVCFDFISESGLTGTDIGEYALPVPNAFLLMRSAAQWIFDEALEHGVDPAFVTLEISENTMINYNFALEENIRALHDAGFSFMLMDYGNGYTDAEMMIKMHLKEVSLNRDLLSSAPVSDKADTMIKCAVDMMKGLSIGIKASGIDSPELEEYALNVGVDKLQGFNLARFLSGADLVKFMKERREDHGVGVLL